MAISTGSLRRSLYGIVALYFTGCAVAWWYLPRKVPLHFGFTGRVTSWVQLSPALWFLLPVLAVGIVALVLAASGPPEGWKLSAADVKRYRRLSADAQTRIRDTVERSTLVALMLFVVTLMSLQVGIFATAVTQTERMPTFALAGIVLSLGGAIVVGTRGQRRVRSQIRSAAGSHHGAESELFHPRG